MEEGDDDDEDDAFVWVKYYRQATKNYWRLEDKKFTLFMEDGGAQPMDAPRTHSIGKRVMYM